MEGKETHRTQKTHVEMLKKENSKVKGKVRRGYHILVHGPRPPTVVMRA